jgi:hypothetical protein
MEQTLAFPTKALGTHGLSLTSAEAVAQVTELLDLGRHHH